MAKYNVLAQITQFVEIEIDGGNAEDAEMMAWKMFKRGELVIDQSPVFVCEEADLIEEENENA